MFCRNCGNEVVENAVACTKCGVHPLNGRKFCQSCGKGTQEAAVVCISCGGQLAGSSAAGSKLVAPKQPPANPMLAGLFNWLWGGAGYIYIGQTTKGIAFCIATLVMYGLDIATCGLFLFVHGPIIIGLIVDVLLVAKRLERGESVGEWKFF